MSEVADYYEILQVHPEAETLVIKKAYRTLMVSGGHPDHGGKEAHARRLTEAYEVLSDPEKRRAYDRDRRRMGRSPNQVLFISLCPHCGVQNRVPSRTKILVAKCGDCGRPLGRVKLPPTRTTRRLRAVSLVSGIAILLFLVAWGGTLAWEAMHDPLREASDLERRGRMTEAIALLQRSLKDDPDSAQGWTQLARDLTWMHRNRDAAEACERLVNLEPDRATSWLWLGLARLRNGEWPAAEAALGQSFKLNPRNPDVLMARAEVCQRTNRVGEAVSLLQAATRMASRDGELWFRLGRALTVNRDPAAAIAAYRQGLAVAPLRADGWRELAHVHQVRHETALYQLNLEKAARLDPQEPRTHLELADLYRATGHPGLAIREYRTALGLLPGDPVTQERVRRALNELGG